MNFIKPIKKPFVFLLAAVILFSSVSCRANEKDEKKDRDVILNVENSCVYSKEGKKALSNRILSLIEKADGGELSKEERSSFLSHCNTTFFPLLERIPIYESELNSVLDTSEDIFELIEKTPSFNDIFKIYEKASGIIGADRSASLFFESLKLYLEHKTLSCQEFASKGKELLKILTQDLGDDTFADIIELFVFFGSAGSETSYDEISSSSVINDSDILSVLKQHARHCASLSIPSDKWRLAAKLFSELFASHVKKDGNISSDVLKALCEDGFFEDAAASMPAFLSLYSSAVMTMTEDDIKLLGSEYKYKLQAVCRVISNREEEFAALLDILEKTAARDESVGISEISGHGKEQAYLSFIDNEEKTSLTELIDALKAHADAPAVTTLGKLNTAMKQYVFKLSPALAFIIELRLADGF